MNLLVPQKHLHPKLKINFLLGIVASFTITFMFFFFVLADVVIWLYQAIYFSINEIPKIKRSTYVIIKRHRLEKLNWAQKWSCAYCEYANGIILWLKAVANQTEIYSCAIKHTHRLPGQEYRADFYEQSEFASKS